MNLRTQATALVLFAAGTAAAQRPSDRGAIADAVGRIVDAANHVNVDKMLLEFMPEAQMMNG